MGNMSYCRFENTHNDFEECLYAIEVNGIEDLSDSELIYARRLVELASVYVDVMEEYEEEDK